MPAIDVLMPGLDARRWQAEVVRRLRELGHDVAVIGTPGSGRWPAAIAAVLRLEGMAPGGNGNNVVGAGDAITDLPPKRPPALTVDLTGDARETSSPTLRLNFAGARSPIAAFRYLSCGHLPDLEVVLDNRAVVARASPMVDNPFLVSRGFGDVLARAITLMVSAVTRFATGNLPELGPVRGVARDTGSGVGRLYLTHALPRLGGELLRRMRYHHAHWRVGYRLINGPGVIETGELGNGWSVLDDDGKRFYADPFPFEHEGRTYVFVEDLPHATHKGLISVAALGDDGRLGVPRPVLEEAYHLSYPQVFARDGETWMLPESSSGQNLVLYRAKRFPEQWERYAVLCDGRELSDATLLEHGGRLWLFATERDGFGSTADTLVVLYADGLEGPWHEHRLNPILIDRTSARPGGAFVQTRGRVVVPIQDGAKGYGSGLGFSEVLQLDTETVQLSPPTAIRDDGDWPHREIHTYNRVGRLEVIDGKVQVRKRT